MSTAELDRSLWGSNRARPAPRKKAKKRRSDGRPRDRHGRFMTVRARGEVGALPWDGHELTDLIDPGHELEDLINSDRIDLDDLI